MDREGGDEVHAAAGEQDFGRALKEYPKVFPDTTPLLPTGRDKYALKIRLTPGATAWAQAACVSCNKMFRDTIPLLPAERNQYSL
ncbi:hypothetical protein NDN08_004456 [Rhodosorus marinus]|uniref:Uncharacterized protein n=1 Tax=Rhodosorus marinus TaxID=101924 RepID=A0AAV8ULG4_9RHOD|nr:hypothetical protein NDN08_004456 [Rhodosorus marinus]